ncbi:MAG: hypothetical protein ACXAEU_01735 [Candidatus Hodarchaeales archaeon]
MINELLSGLIITGIHLEHEGVFIKKKTVQVKDTPLLTEKFNCHYCGEAMDLNGDHAIII